MVLPVWTCGYDVGMWTAERTLASLPLPVRMKVPLGPMTWYGVGGPAAVFAQPRGETPLQQLVIRCREQDVPLYVLGSGANLLVRDGGVDGVVVKLDDPAFAQCMIEGDRVHVGAGYDMFKLVPKLAKMGLGGLENLAGIPASVGGAVRMNAGGAFGEIGDYVQAVRVMDADGRTRTLIGDNLSFAYRYSSIREPLILEVVFALSPDDPQRLVKRMKEIFEYKKHVQPMGAKSAGCAFKNPKQHPGNPRNTDRATPAGCGEPQRLSAGKLIDEAGLKGFRIGSAEVSTRHANFIHVAEKGGKADDVLAVIEHVEQVVQDRHGIALEREVVIWP